MNTYTIRPHARPPLHLPLFLSRPNGAAAKRTDPFPLSTDQLRRTVAEMVG